MTTQGIEIELLANSINTAGVRIAGALENCCDCYILYIASQALLEGFAIGRNESRPDERKEITAQILAVGLGLGLLFRITSDCKKGILDYMGILFLARFVGKNLPF